MTIADPFHAEVARLALSVAQQYGFALGGGNAFLAYGLVDRLTEDVDLFSHIDGAAATAAQTVREELEAAGFSVVEEEGTSWLADVIGGFELDMVEFEVSRGEQLVRLSLARLDRTRGPIAMDVGPVLHLDDVLGSKVAALVGRAQVRDYIDVAAALGRFTSAELRTLALRLDPGLTERDFADAGSRLDRLPDAVFARYDLGPAEVAELRERFADWPRAAVG